MHGPMMNRWKELWLWMRPMHVAIFLLPILLVLVVALVVLATRERTPTTPRW